MTLRRRAAVAAGSRRRSTGTTPPALTTPPAVTGVGQTGNLLTTTVGTWTGSPASYAYQWLRDGAAISGATANTYTLTSGDQEKTITCQVTASNGSGSVPATSNKVIGLPALSTAQGLAFVGNPFMYQATAAARQPFDLQVFDGNLFFAHGDATSNKGPVPVIRFDGDTLHNDYTTNEEAIWQFTIRGGDLFFSTLDPRGRDRLGFYRLDTPPAGWTARRTASIDVDVSHTYGIEVSGGTIYLGAEDNNIWKSVDDGVTYTVDLDGGASGPWYYLFTLGSTKWGYAYANTYPGGAYNGWAKFNTSTGRFEDQNISSATTYPTVSMPNTYLVWTRMLVVGSYLLYIGGEWDNSSALIADPFKLYRTANPTTTSTAVALPAGYIPYDIIDDGVDVHLLCNIFNGTNDWTVSVLKANSRTVLTAWTEQFTFDATTIAKSFERLDGVFYFGLGFPDSAHADTGDVYQYTP